MRNTDRLGISSRHLIAAHGLTWVVHRQLITARRWPRLGETVTALTAPVRIDRKLVTYRDFHLIDAGGRSILQSASSWSVMEIHSRRLRRIPDTIVDSLTDLPAKADHLPWHTDKPQPPIEISATENFRVHFADLDFNNHLTNPAFAQLMLEPLGPDHLTHAILREADISYHHEARYGEELRASVGPAKPADTTFAHDLRRGDQLLATMRSRWT